LPWRRLKPTVLKRIVVANDLLSTGCRAGNPLVLKRGNMRASAVAFLVIALLAAVVGFAVALLAAVGGFAGIALATAGVAKVVFLFFLALFLIFLMGHTMRRLYRD
jgi:uncharacterized membrane protein YtjA (UPF0391 family)